jgi:hypothetical protein
MTNTDKLLQMMIKMLKQFFKQLSNDWEWTRIKPDGRVVVTDVKLQV